MVPSSQANSAAPTSSLPVSLAKQQYSPVGSSLPRWRTTKLLSGQVWYSGHSGTAARPVCRP